jgi:DNA-binding NarL/FixJ family response regulator
VFDADEASIRILIADDHAVVLEGLVALIGRQSDMKIVAQASNGAEAVDEWNNHRPDVSLLDLRMPALDALGVIDRIRETDPAARFLVLTTFDTDEDNTGLLNQVPRATCLRTLPGTSCWNQSARYMQAKPALRQN